MASSSSASAPSTRPPQGAMAAMAAAVFSSSASAESPSSPPSQPARRRRKSAFNDVALLRIFAEKDPLNAPHGAKGAAWEDVGIALANEPGENRVWTGQACRTRILSLLEGFEAHTSGKKTPQTIRQLSANAMKLLERTFYRVAKTRIARAPLGEGLAPGSSVASAPPSTVVVPTALKQPPPQAKPLVHAVAAPRPVTDAASTIVMPTKATVVAKRRKRKGVKTKEQKRASAMAEALRNSRETYMNQLRVETAAQAAAKETGDSPAKPKTSATTSKAKPDLDLSLLRAVVKHSAVEATEPATITKRWQAVAEQVMTHTALKFTPTAIRDRYDALLTDFEVNDCKTSTYMSGVAVADEERLKLLRMIHKAREKQRRMSLDTPQEKRSSAKAAAIDDATAIEIDDTGEEQEEEDSSKNAEQEQIIEETEEEDDTDEQKEDASAPPASRKRRRRESEIDIEVNNGGVSPDADPAAALHFEIDDVQNNSQDSTVSHDYTPRKYKQIRQANAPDGDVDAPVVRSTATDRVGALLEAMTAERRERRYEFGAILDVMKTQINDNRSKWEREYAQRARELDARHRESSALLDVLRKEREDRKSEVAALMATVSKEREDRRNEFMVMMNLVTKMIESKSTPAPDASK